MNGKTENPSACTDYCINLCGHCEICPCVFVCLTLYGSLTGVEVSESEQGLSAQVEELQHLLQDKQKELQQVADHTHTHLEQSLQLRHLQNQVKQVTCTGQDRV